MGWRDDAPDPGVVRVPGPWTHRDISANGIRLHITERGSGPLVLMLHGFGEFWWSWRHQLTALSDAGYRAVAVDLRGYGDSDKPPRGYDGWTLSGDVAGLIRALGEPRAHLVGHGWGGMLGWTVSVLHPRLLYSLTAVSAPHPLALRREIRRTALRGKRTNQARACAHILRAQFPMLPERRLCADDAAALEELFRRWAGPTFPGTEEFAEMARRDREAVRIPGVAHCSMEFYRWAGRAQLRSEGRRFTEELDRPSRVPVLQLHGETDGQFRIATARASSPWAGEQAELRTLPDTGYFAHQEAPATTSAALLDFLTR